MKPKTPLEIWQELGELEFASPGLTNLPPLRRKPCASLEWWEDRPDLGTGGIFKPKP